MELSLNAIKKEKSLKFSLVFSSGFSLTFATCGAFSFYFPRNGQENFGNSKRKTDMMAVDIVVIMDLIFRCVPLERLFFFFLWPHFYL